jgi:hypothetical protein
MADRFIDALLEATAAADTSAVSIRRMTSLPYPCANKSIMCLKADLAMNPVPSVSCSCECPLVSSWQEGLHALIYAALYSASRAAISGLTSMTL